jgi:hypothetical protein
MYKRILLVAIPALLFIGSMVYLFGADKKADTPEPGDKPTNSVVLLDNAQDFAIWLPDKDVTKVEQTIYNRVKEYTASPLAIYHGSIRATSFETRYTEYTVSDPPINVPTVTYIVDIPDAKQSYMVSKSGGENYPYNILYVLCVPKEQTKYADFGCKDEF